MPEEMNVVIENLRVHTSKIDGAAAQLTEAADASQQVTMSNDAYGVLCQPFAKLIDMLEQKSVDTLNQAVQALTETGDLVRSTVQGYQNTDDENAERFGGID